MNVPYFNPDSGARFLVVMSALVRQLLDDPVHHLVGLHPEPHPKGVSTALEYGIIRTLTAVNLGIVHAQRSVGLTSDKLTQDRPQGSNLSPLPAEHPVAAHQV